MQLKFQLHAHTKWKWPLYV